MPIANTRQLIDCEIEGRVRNYFWRKLVVALTPSGHWLDTSILSGNPTAQYYIGNLLTATRLTRTTNGGIQHGPNVSPSNKYIRSLSLSYTFSGSPVTAILADYLMFYPFIDMDLVGQQVLINTNTLPRYPDGDGVQVMAVQTNVGIGLGGQSFYFTYTNSEGVSGRTSQTVVAAATNTLGIILSSSVSTANGSGNPFIGLQSGDSGVRSIESVTILGADPKLFALVLVKPLLYSTVREIESVYEKDMLLMGNQIPRVIDDAFLGILLRPNSNMLGNSAPCGDLKVVWD